MIPRTSSGRGFKGAAAYYLHDKGATTSDRVRFTYTHNLANDNPRRAVAEMIYTSEHAADLKAANGIKNTGRKLDKPVYTFSLSWHPSEEPTDEQMKAAALSALKALKMDHHQVLMVAHNDTDHPHIHLMVNRTDPVTGKAHGLNKDHLVLSRWAQDYERDYGHTWCTDRVKKNAERQQAAIDKAKGLLQSAFVKNSAAQQRDQRPEYDRRAKAIEAKRRAREARRLAKEGLSPVFTGRASAAGDQARQQAAVMRAAAQQAARDARGARALQVEQDRASRRDALQNQREMYRAPEIAAPDDPVKAAKAFRKQLQEDRRRPAFEAWQIAQTNALQDRHNEQRDAVAKDWEHRRGAVESQIEQQYGQSRRAAEERLAALSARQQRDNSIGRLIERVQGTSDERANLEKTLESIAQRTSEMRGAVSRQEEVARAELEAQHHAQKRDQALLFERQEKAGYQIPTEGTPPPGDRVPRREGPERGGRDLG